MDTLPVMLTAMMVLLPLINNDISLNDIKEAAASYTQYACEHEDYMCKLYANTLNKHG